MKFRTLFVLSLLMIPVLLSAQEKLESTLLWKVEGPEIETSFLFGTIHVLPQSQFELKDKVKKAFGKTDMLVMELDMDDPSMQMDMIKYSMMKDGQTLDKLMDEEDYKLLDEKLKSIMGMGVAMFNNWKPFVVSTLLYAEYLGEQPASFELSLMAMAKEEEMEIEGLESVQEQLAIFDTISYEDQVEEITQMLGEEGEEFAEYFAEMVEVYKTEDINEMDVLTGEYFEDETQEKLLLADRNKRWIPKMEELADEESVFFAVGAGHLGGEEGVINLLRMQGYKVTPIKD